MLVGQFPEIFFNRIECTKFTSKKREEIDKDINVIKKSSRFKFRVKILGHEITCVEDGSGEPT
jgi:hypothetical protein